MDTAITNFEGGDVLVEQSTLDDMATVCLTEPPSPPEEDEEEPDTALFAGSDVPVDSSSPERRPSTSPTTCEPPLMSNSRWTTLTRVFRQGLTADSTDDQLQKKRSFTKIFGFGKSANKKEGQIEVGSEKEAHMPLNKSGSLGKYFRYNKSAPKSGGETPVPTEGKRSTLTRILKEKFGSESKGESSLHAAASDLPPAAPGCKKPPAKSHFLSSALARVMPKRQAGDRSRPSSSQEHIRNYDFKYESD